MTIGREIQKSVITSSTVSKHLRKKAIKGRAKPVPVSISVTFIPATGKVSSWVSYKHISNPHRLLAFQISRPGLCSQAARTTQDSFLFLIKNIRAPWGIQTPPKFTVSRWHLGRRCQRKAQRHVSSGDRSPGTIADVCRLVQCHTSHILDTGS